MTANAGTIQDGDHARRLLAARQAKYLESDHAIQMAAANDLYEEERGKGMRTTILDIEMRLRLKHNSLKHWRGGNRKIRNKEPKRTMSELYRVRRENDLCVRCASPNPTPHWECFECRISKSRKNAQGQ